MTGPDRGDHVRILNADGQPRPIVYTVIKVRGDYARITEQPSRGTHAVLTNWLRKVGV